MRKASLSLCLLILITLVHSINYTKVIHNFDPEAKCLDGSSPAVYMHQGSKPENILIWLVGNGTCFVAKKNYEENLLSCY